MQTKASTNPKIEKKPGCVAAAAAILGDKWTPLIITKMAADTNRFSLLEQSLKGISPRTLSQRLDALEHCGVITKKSYAEVPPRVEYKLTQKGQDLFPILKSMADWGSKYYS